MSRRGAAHGAPLGTAVAALAVIVALLTPVSGQAPAAVLRFGLTGGVIDGASAADARAAARVWADGISGDVGLFHASEASAISTVEEGAQALAADKMDLLVLSAFEYLSAEKSLQCRPGFVYEIMGEAMQEFVLIGRKNAVVPAHPSDKSIAVFSTNRQADTWPTVWADAYFRDTGLPAGLKAFGQVRPIDRRGRATMAVFFGQTDFGIDTLTAFTGTIELNPQVGKDLAILARSAPLLPGLVCLNNRMPPALRERYIERATHIHEQTRYRQALTIMRVTRLLPWDPRYLDSARALLAKAASHGARR